MPTNRLEANFVELLAYIERRYPDDGLLRRRARRAYRTSQKYEPMLGTGEDDHRREARLMTELGYLRQTLEIEKERTG